MNKVKKNLESVFQSDENLLKAINFVSCQNEVSYPSSNSDNDASGEEDSEMVKLLQNKDKAIEKLENDKVALEKKINKQEEDFKELLDEKLAIECKHNQLKEDYDKRVKFKCDSLISGTVDDLSTIKNIIDKRLLDLKTMNSKRPMPMRDISNLQPSTSNLEEQDPLADDNNDADNHSQSPHLSEVHTQPKTKSKKPKCRKGKEPTNFVITSEHLANVDKSSVQQFTRGILDALFDDEELRTCCLTGKQSNAFKHLHPRPALDQNKIAAARNYCYKLFGKQQNCISLFNYTAGQKLNDMKKL